MRENPVICFVLCYVKQSQSSVENWLYDSSEIARLTKTRTDTRRQSHSGSRTHTKGIRQILGTAGTYGPVVGLYRSSSWRATASEELVARDGTH